MRLLKPAWLHHDGNPIFSIDIHPDDTRVVTGGQGNDSVGRVVIWNMQPILSAEDDKNVPRLLCQLDHHNACVNCVRWSNSGKYLSSGGDDRVIIIWKLVSKYSGHVNSSSTSQNSAFGKTNLEQWKTSSMLRSHTGDILDLAWSPGDKYLASASVDNTVIVWDAQNFPQIITTLKGHNSLVKGVTWDPVGKYLASQSDDKTLKIWRASDWELEHSVQDPFIECGGTTHVLRLDWSPDGLYLVSAHAMNGGGPTAQIVERTEWKTDKDFVGHRKAVVCVKFNSSIMQSDNSRVKHCCVALGSRDRSVSIWSTALKRPLVVIKDLFTNSVMDLSWSSCGTILVACSWDGSVAVAQFSWKEIGKSLTAEEKTKFYHKLYGKSAVYETCDIIQNLEVFLAKNNTPVTHGPENSVSEAKLEQRISPDKSDSQSEHLVKGPIDKQIETRTADGRRRITPKFLLPPSGDEEVTPTQSEQAIFLQVKSKDILNQSTVDWRKSMVSSIENVKGFENSNKTEQVKTPGENISTSGSSGSQVKSPKPEQVTPGENLSTCGNSGSQIKSPKADSHGQTEPMDLEVNDNPADSRSPPKLVNGNSSHGIKDDGKCDASPPVLAPIKEKMVNGDGSVGLCTEENSTGKDAEMPSLKIVEPAPPTPTSNGPVLSNDEKPPEIFVKMDEGDNTPLKKPVELPIPPPGVSVINVRKKKITPTPEEQSKPKKVKLNVSAEMGTTGSQPGQKHKEPPANHHMASHSATHSHGKSESPKGRLPPMKLESVLHLRIDVRPDCTYDLTVTNNNARPDGVCHQVVCSHSSLSFNGLDWTMCTDAPICGVAGDSHRIVLLCENSTAHVLDTKGRYAFPPIVLSAHPSKSVLSGPFLGVVTTKAIIHVWNIHSKCVVVKSESLLPLLHQGDADKNRVFEISRFQLVGNGQPLIVLNTGKTFMYSLELTSWYLLSDQRGLVSSPLISSSHDQNLSSRMLFNEGKLKSKPEPAVVSHIKLKLATCTEMKNSEGIKQWLVTLAKSLASHGLDKELHQLCEDLLGPTHSSAKLSSNWNPTIVGQVNKRKVLRTILKSLLEDLKYQDFYSEFDELLKEVEETDADLSNNPVRS